MEKYYHLYTTALKKCQLFRNDSDRIFFLNRLAIYRAEYNVIIYVYCLMDNHLHLLVSGEEEAILAFFRQLKTIYGWYLSKSKTDVVDVDLTEFNANLRVIKGEDDFKTVVAYILRNPFVAGIDSPFSYKWNSAYLYFNPRVEYFRGIPLKDYGMRRTREVLKTRVTLPESYTVFEDMFSPVSWCNFRRVERVFTLTGMFVTMPVVIGVIKIVESLLILFVPFAIKNKGLKVFALILAILLAISGILGSLSWFGLYIF